MRGQARYRGGWLRTIELAIGDASWADHGGLGQENEKWTPDVEIAHLDYFPLNPKT